MSQRAAWIVCTLLLSGPGLCRSAQAEVEPSPLVEMRAAAESLAELQPESTARSGAAPLPGMAKAPAGERKDLLREAVREAVRSEVAKERVSLARSASGRGAAKSDNAADNGNSASGQAHSTAAQAQQAKRNNEVSLQHRQNMGKGPTLTPPGQERAPGQGSHPR